MIQIAIPRADIPGHGWSLIRSAQVQGCICDLFAAGLNKFRSAH